MSSTPSFTFLLSVGGSFLGRLALPVGILVFLVLTYSMCYSGLYPHVGGIQPGAVWTRGPLWSDMSLMWSPACRNLEHYQNMTFYILCRNFP